MRHLKYFANVTLIALFASASSAIAQAPRGAEAVTRQNAAPTQPSAIAAPITDAASAAREDLREAARAWMADQLRQPLDSIEIGALDARVDPSVCDGPFAFDFPFQTRTTIRARCHQPARQLFLRAAVASLEARLTVNRDLPAGHVLRAQDLSTRMLRQGISSPLDSSQVTGRALTRSLQAGEALEPRDLDEVVTIARTVVALREGDRVTSAMLQLDQLPRRSAPPGALLGLDGAALTLRRSVPAGHLLLADDLIDARPVLVARRHLMRGDRLDGSAFEMVERDRRQVPPDHITSAEGLDHAELIAPLRAGDILRSSQVRRSTVVRKGQVVLLTINRSGIEINVQVEAMEDARLGDSFKLRNPDSGKTLAGVATGQGTARAL